MLGFKQQIYKTRQISNLHQSLGVGAVGAGSVAAPRLSAVIHPVGDRDGTGGEVGSCRSSNRSSRRRSNSVSGGVGGSGGDGSGSARNSAGGGTGRTGRFSSGSSVDGDESTELGDVDRLSAGGGAVGVSTRGGAGLGSMTTAEAAGDPSEFEATGAINRGEESTLSAAEAAAEVAAVEEEERELEREFERQRIIEECRNLTSPLTPTGSMASSSFFSVSSPQPRWLRAQGSSGLGIGAGSGLIRTSDFSSSSHRFGSGTSRTGVSSRRPSRRGSYISASSGEEGSADWEKFVASTLPAVADNSPAKQRLVRGGEERQEQDAEVPTRIADITADFSADSLVTGAERAGGLAAGGMITGTGTGDVEAVVGGSQRGDAGNVAKYGAPREAEVEHEAIEGEEEEEGGAKGEVCGDHGAMAYVADAAAAGSQKFDSASGGGAPRLTVSAFCFFLFLGQKWKRTRGNLLCGDLVEFCYCGNGHVEK